MDQLDLALDFGNPSLASLSLHSMDTRHQNLYRIPTAKILPEHSYLYILKNTTGKYQDLSPIYQDLTADANSQKEALAHDQIILSAWELLIFTLFKSLTTKTSWSQSSVSSEHFFDLSGPISDDIVNKMDKNERVRALNPLKMDK